MRENEVSSGHVGRVDSRVRVTRRQANTRSSIPPLHPTSPREYPPAFISGFILRLSGAVLWVNGRRARAPLPVRQHRSSSELVRSPHGLGHVWVAGSQQPSAAGGGDLKDVSHCAASTSLAISRLLCTHHTSPLGLSYVSALLTTQHRVLSISLPLLDNAAVLTMVHTAGPGRRDI